MKALVVGYGNMGRRHSRILTEQGHEVVGHVDPEGGLRSIEDSPPAEVAVISTPPSELVEQACRAISLGMDVLVEKPMALTVESAEHLRSHAQHHGAKMRIGFTERFNPVVNALFEVLHLVGTIQHIGISRLGPRSRVKVGVAHDLATHDLDILRYLGFSPEPKGVVAGDGTLVCDLAINGARATLSVSHRYDPKVRTLTVTGSEGMLALDYQAQSLTFTGPVYSEAIAVDRAEPLAQQWRGFFNGEGATADDAIEVLRMVEQIEEKASATSLS